MKRLSLALIALGINAPIFAAYPAATDPTEISVPDLPGGLIVGGTALYLQPSINNDDLAYAIEGITTNSATPLQLKLFEVDPGHDWGWGANIGYIFPQTGNDVNLSYWEFDAEDNNTAPFSSSFIYNSINPLNFIRGMDASGQANIDVDQWDLALGQYIDVGCHLVLHPTAGVRYSDIARSFTSFDLGDPDGPFTGSVEKSDFDGVGPTAGIDASYYLTDGVGLVGHFGSALLIGNIDSRTFIPNIGGGFVLINTKLFNSDSSTRLVPELTGKLGADYTFVFNNAMNSDLTLEVGYQINQDFNAVDRIYAANIGQPTFAFSAHKTSDLTLQGPYASLTLHV